MMKKLIHLLSCLPFIACTSNQSIKTKAYIFQRKASDNGKLMVCYTYNMGKHAFLDSGIIENTILPQDSVSIVYQKNNPANSQLLLIPGN